MIGQLGPCSNCRFWHSVTGPDLEDNERGECRRYAPRAGSSAGGDPYVSWAETWGEDWCGEYLPLPITGRQR